ncbi:MAG TPA: YifB family Mg chelatase-like AAA ATPase [Candidatus Paceibacterota bacterium]|nr:YifB family Mg chelatase-like AAA ATPase [Candidatus Paceibacterota bacterium]
MVYFSKIHSAHAGILDAKSVDVEVDISNGLHSFVIIGLGDKSITEARDRVSSAIKNSGFISPKQKNQKIVVSLAPANLQKNGTSFDVPIAIGYLQASGQVSLNTKDRLFVGELSLDGKLKKTKGVLSTIIFAKKSGFKEIFIPKANEAEGSLISGIKILPATHLIEIINHTKNPNQNNPQSKIKEIEKNNHIVSNPKITNNTFDQIIGNEVAKRGMLIAGSGGHNISLYGPPGTGKTMLAKSFSEILPPLNEKQKIECSSIYSSSGNLEKIVTTPPFRAPHHSSSYVSLVGGGTNLKIGEITLAHNGVLFLDEFPEFDSRVINSLRQPLEDKKIIISRAIGTETFPAKFILVTSMNPCPCGYYKSDSKKCICNQSAINKYQRKISGPIIDRIDIWIGVSKVNYKKLGHTALTDGFSLEKTRSTIISTQKIQKTRSGKLNGELDNSEIKKYCQLNHEAKTLLEKSSEKIKISLRGYFKTIKLARTIADIDNSEKIKEPHVLEALQYRYRDF